MRHLCVNYCTLLYLIPDLYNAFNVYRRELAPGTVSLTGDRAQGDDSKHWAYSSMLYIVYCHNICTLHLRSVFIGVLIKPDHTEPIWVRVWYLSHECKCI